MHQQTVFRTSSVLLGVLCLAAAIPAQNLTPAERDQALNYLTQSRDGLVAAVKGLSDAQWTFKPGPDRWSIAEIVEHLAVVEERVDGIVSKLGESPAPPAGRDVKEIDARILADVPDRSTKYKAPPAIEPTGRWTPSGALEHFLIARAEVTALLRSTPDLRAHVVNHPVLGLLDGYEWILVTAAHSARHTQQILEVKADPHFPAN
ncbi:MAG: DinB family protein [Acidobacteriaceae bacterium]|nr:DinB family protein [Acidobacteriaceae bacterium]